MTEPITTTVTVAKVQTMADGGLRFIFDAPETETLQAAQFMECKRWGVVGKLTFEALEKEPEAEENEPEQQRSARKIHI
jgi:hypothetical protein